MQGAACTGLLWRSEWGRKGFMKPPLQGESGDAAGEERACLQVHLQPPGSVEEV